MNISPSNSFLHMLLSERYHQNCHADLATMSMNRLSSRLLCCIPPARTTDDAQSLGPPARSPPPARPTHPALPARGSHRVRGSTEVSIQRSSATSKPLLPWLQCSSLLFAHMRLHIYICVLEALELRFQEGLKYTYRQSN